MKNFTKPVLSASALLGGLFAGVVAAGATEVLYAHTDGAQQTHPRIGSFELMPGLQLTVPPASLGSSHALVILNVPSPYSEGSNFPGAEFVIAVDGFNQSPVAIFTADFQNPPSTGRHPVTLVTQIDLTSVSRTVTAKWMGIRGSTAKIDTQATLSAIVE